MNKDLNNFAEAIREIVLTFGKGLLCESRVVNILTDYNAFKEVPQAKFILKSMISEGYIEYLIVNKEWNELCDKLLDKFILYTGVQENLVKYVFACLSYGLEWNNIIPVLEINNTNTTTTHFTPSGAPYPNNNPSMPIINKKCEDMDDDEFEQYIWSKIQWDHNLENKAGLTFSNYQISSFNFCTGFKILFEVKGTLKTEELKLLYTAYDNSGRLRAHDTAVWIFKGKVKPVDEINVFFYKPLDILEKVTFSASYD